MSHSVASSYKEPFLVLHKDKVVLRPKASVPKVVSVLYLNQYIVLHSLLVATKLRNS